MFKPRKPWPGRFWEKVNKTDGCWLWTASLDTSGYGQIKVEGRARMATHIAWELNGGTVPPGALLCHTCDTPACVNPAHLFIGDHTANATDMVTKGRSARGDKSTSRLYPGLRQRGIAHPKAKFTDDQVREIRHRSRNGETQRQIARAYGVAKNTIQMIVEGKTWKHVNP